MSRLVAEYALPDSTATDALGRALCRAFAPSATAGGVIHLSGELGAGKTTCVRSLLREAGVTGLVRSPTYTLLETYVLPSFTAVHLDLYRVQSPEEVEELGVRDWLGAGYLALIEWPEKGGFAVPPADLGVELGYALSGRIVRLKSFSEAGVRWCTKLRMDGSLSSYVSHLI